MNWFGHMMLAWDDESDRAFSLGAALPDLARMAGCPRVVDVGASRYADGVAHHHRVDAAFHSAPSFLSLLTDGAAMLEKQGIRRGIARAAVHVGIELHLDGTLSERDRARELMTEFLQAGRTKTLHAAMSWGEADADRWTDLIARLESGPFPETWRDPASVARRVVRILGLRRRLAPTEAESVVLAEGLIALATPVTDAASDLIPERR